MTKAQVLHRQFIIELQHDGVEYHIRISSDLKDIFDYDVVGNKNHKVPMGETEMLGVLWEEFMTNRLDLDG